jgi:sulfate adenylyltransferase subunit 1 (EFTu-like GTPase family)
LVLNDIARVVIQLKTPLVVDAYSSNRAGGSAIAIDPVTNATIGALMVVGQEDDQPLASTKKASSTTTSPKKGVRGFVKDFFTLKVNEEF